MNEVFLVIGGNLLYNPLKLLRTKSGVMEFWSNEKK